MRPSGRRSSTGEPDVIHEERRRSYGTSVLAAGSLACPRCDAPVWPGGAAIHLGDELACPFCHHGAPARAFLSREQPTRPARVTVRMRHSPAPFAR